MRWWRWCGGGGGDGNERSGPPHVKSYSDAADVQGALGWQPVEVGDAGDDPLDGGAEARLHRLEWRGQTAPDVGRRLRESNTAHAATGHRRVRQETRLARAGLGDSSCVCRARSPTRRRVVARQRARAIQMDNATLQSPTHTRLSHQSTERDGIGAQSGYSPPALAQDTEVGTVSIICGFETERTTHLSIRYHRAVDSRANKRRYSYEDECLSLSNGLFKRLRNKVGWHSVRRGRLPGEDTDGRPHMRAIRHPARAPTGALTRAKDGAQQRTSVLAGHLAG